MDLTETIAPKSDQINAEDLISGPRTFTVERVSKGSTEQPVNIYLIELPGRPYRPSKSMRRVLVNAWGKDGDAYAGRRLTLYRDPSVKFGGDEVGGIKISHLSGIDGRKTLALTVKRGQRAPHSVDPLPADAPTAAIEPSLNDVMACTNMESLREMYRASSSEHIRTKITARVADLQAKAAK